MKNVFKITKIILLINFIVFNTLYFIWPLNLIIEDIKNQTMIGTDIDLAVLYPWLISLISIPIIIFQIIFMIIFRKYQSYKTSNTIAFYLFLLQNILFNVLLII